MMASAVVITDVHMMARAALVIIWAGVIAPGLVGVVAFSVRPETMARPLVLRCFMLFPPVFDWLPGHGMPSWIYYHFRRKKSRVCDTFSRKTSGKIYIFLPVPWPPGVDKTAGTATSFCGRRKRFILKLT